jgi:hypothetical protein
MAPCKLHSASDKPAFLFLEDRCQCSGGTSFFHLQSSKFPKMEKAVFSNKLISVYQATQCHIPEDNIRLSHDHGNYEPQISERIENFKTCYCYDPLKYIFKILEK